MNSFFLARILILIGVAVSIFNSWTIFLHVGNPDYVLIANAPSSATHVWDHNFKELLGDLATIALIMLVFFGSQRFRTRESWVMIATLMAGYYAGFWIGIPFIPELAADAWTAEATHLGMAIPSVLGLILARKHFLN